MALLEVGDLLPGATTISNDNVNPVWRGNVVMGNGKRVVAFAKQVSNRELVVEVIAALLGRVLQLPIPRPLLIQVLPVSLPSAHLSQPAVFFGSERIDTPDLAQWLSESDASSTMAALRKWPQAVATGCFDEWLANHDRHHRNILYDGKRQFILIDHSHALPPGLSPESPAEDNVVMGLVTHGARKQQLQALRKKAEKALGAYQAIPLAEFLGETLTARLDRFHSSAEMIDFLQTRLNYLGQIINQRLGEKQRDLYHDPFSNSPFA